MDLNKLRDEAFRIAKEHGCHNQKHSDEHCMMLVITEIAEAVEADRKNMHAQRAMFENNAYTPQPNPEKHWKFIYEKFLKGSVEEELADVVIRCLDFAGMRNVDLQNTLSDIPDMNELEEKFGGIGFAEMAYYICEGIIRGRYLKDIAENPIKDIVEYCKYAAIDIEWFIDKKMKYNSLREYKHGKKY